MQALLKYIFAACLFLPSVGSAIEEQHLYLLREDGSELRGYIVTPEIASFPIALLIQGSQCESAAQMHRDYQESAIRFGAGLITLEKQGVYGPNLIEMKEYNRTNCSAHRIKDHMMLIQSLREGLIPHWNGKLIVIGGSEGGSVGCAIASSCPEVIAAALYSTGGGMASHDEITLAFRKHLEKEGYSSASIRMQMAFFEQQLATMVANPTHESHFYDYTYKWWACYLSAKRSLLAEILSINCPLLYVHGVEDDLIPVESADLAVDEYHRIGKKRLTYLRLEGYGHDVRLPPFDIFGETWNWLTLVLKNQKVHQEG